MNRDKVPPPDSAHIEVLKKHFGHSEFRPTQWEIIHSILVQKRDTCAIMATGYGKSLCYQFPAVFSQGVALVVSPLISLMQDQVLNLQVLGIPAVFMGAAQTAKAKAINNTLEGLYRIVYVTPEWCLGEMGADVLTQLAKSNNLTLVAIDEAHCVSQWGFDFRPKYRRLGELRDMLAGVPFLAVTATATPQVRRDIVSSLHLKHSQMLVTGFDRPNLYFSVKLKDSDRDIIVDLEKLMVADGLAKKFPGPTIVYCPTKKATEKVALALSQAGINCAVYHADLSQKMRKEVHESFVRDHIPVVVATVAFGMGIDKPDVRTIIHYGAPKEIESYYQEVGRAGRDGLPATCHIFYSPADFTVNKYFLSSLHGVFREHREKMFRRLQQYLETDVCRRKQLIEFFDEQQARELPENRRCCDNCSGNKLFKSKRPDLDLREDALRLLGAVHLLEGRFGLGVPIKFLLGKPEQRYPASYTRHQLYGSGKDDSENWWKALGRLLVKEGLLAEKPVFRQAFGKSRFPVSTTAITQLGEQYLLKDGQDEVLKLIPNPEVMSMAGKKLRLAAAKAAKEKEQRDKEARRSKGGGSSTEAEGVGDWSNHEDLGTATGLSQMDATDEVSEEEARLQNTLYKALVNLRSKLAADHDIMPYMVANNKTLLELARLRPMDKHHLMQVEGLGQVKVDKFGDAILAKIKEIIGFHVAPSIPVPVLKRRESERTFAEEKPKVQVPIKKEIKYESDEDEVVVKQEPPEEEIMEEEKTNEGDDLWGEDMDESYLAEMDLDESVSGKDHVKLENDINEDVWGNAARKKHYLQRVLSQYEAPKKYTPVKNSGEESPQASGRIESSSQNTVKKGVCYESDDDAPKPPDSKKRTNVDLAKDKHVDKDLMRKKKLKSLLC